LKSGKCGNQMGTEFWSMVFDEHGIGGEYCGCNDEQLGRRNVFCHVA